MRLSTCARRNAINLGRICGIWDLPLRAPRRLLPNEEGALVGRPLPGALPLVPVPVGALRLLPRFPTAAWLRQHLRIPSPLPVHWWGGLDLGPASSGEYCIR